MVKYLFLSTVLSSSLDLWGEVDESINGHAGSRRRQRDQRQKADAIRDYCYQFTPPAFDDAQRHEEWWEKTVDWENFFWGSDSA